MPEVDPQPHNRTAYVKGCRCNICVDANKEYQREYMRQWRIRKREKEQKISPIFGKYSYQ